QSNKLVLVDKRRLSSGVEKFPNGNTSVNVDENIEKKSVAKFEAELKAVNEEFDNQTLTDVISFAVACRSKDGLKSDIVKFEHNDQTHRMKVTCFDGGNLPLFSTRVHKQGKVVGPDCVLEPLDDRSVQNFKD